MAGAFERAIELVAKRQVGLPANSRVCAIDTGYSDRDVVKIHRQFGVVQLRFLSERADPVIGDHTGTEIAAGGIT